MIHNKEELLIADSAYLFFQIGKYISDKNGAEVLTNNLTHEPAIVCLLWMKQTVR